MSFFGIPMRNGLSLGLGTVASLTNGPGFLPSELFYNGTVQGAWYDPSDLTTLFQDSAGTTPVTAVEQPVGLMLDKSKGLVLGSELFSTFGTVTAPWTAQGGGVWSIDGSQAGSRDLSQAVQYTVGRFYVTRFTLSGVTGGTVTVFAGEGSVGPTYGNGTFTIRSYSSQAYLIFRAPAGVAATVSGISVRELPGNHAFQTTSASRPTLRARYNLLTRSEEFDNAAWTKNAGSITATNITDPLGGSTADKFTPNTAATQHYVRQDITVGTISYVFSIYAKADGIRYCVLNPYDTADRRTWFDLVAGTVSSNPGGSTATITAVGNGWYRCSISRTVAASPVQFIINGTSSASDVNVAENGTDSIFFWGAQLTAPSVFPSNTYQRIGASTDYATGAAFPPYLAFDGVDDSMLTNSVDFSGTDKMLVVAGVTKQSDAGTGTVVELSSSAANNGMFDIFAPDSPNEYVYGSRASTTYRNALIDSAAYAAPITNVVTGISDIAAPLVNLRLNGASINSNTASQGTGNFGNYPLYIGRRNNATLPFNGNIYSLIIAGQSYAAGQITSTEQWVAARTPLGTL